MIIGGIMKSKRGLKVYFIHSTKIDYNNLIYLPVLRSRELSHHRLVFSQTEDNKDKYYKDLIASADLLVVELTSPDIGFNMELKEAITSKKPILALAQKNIGYDSKYQKLLKNVIGYGNEVEFRYFVETFVKNYDERMNAGKTDPTVVLGVLN